MPGPAPLSARLKNVKLRDQKTQLGLASAVAAIVLILAFLSLPGSGNKTSATTANSAGNTSQISNGGTQANKPVATAGGTLGKSNGSVSAPGNVSSLSPSAIAKLPPLTATTIKIGFTYLEDPNTANCAAGFCAIGNVDQKRAEDAMVKLINANPPGGRKVIPVYYHQNTSQVESKGAQQIEQEACSYFTKDNPVFMVFDGALIGSTDTFHSCATKAHIPEIGIAQADTSQTFQQFPYFVAPSSAAFDRIARVEVDQLYKQGYFAGFKNNVPPEMPQKPVNGKPLIGLIRYDTQNHNIAAAAMKAELAKYGLSLCSGCEWQITYSATDPAQELGGESTQMNEDIAAAKAKGVTHMLFLGSTAGVRITLFFVEGAEKQDYRPRLGFNPQDAPTAVRDLQASQNDAYQQYIDSILVDDSPGEFGTVTDAYNTCKKIFEAAGETFTGSQAANKEAQIPDYCDGAWYYIAAMKAVSGTLTPDSFMGGVANMKSVPSAGVYLMQTKSDRHDGSGAVRDGPWADSCKCFKPDTPAIPV